MQENVSAVVADVPEADSRRPTDLRVGQPDLDRRLRSISHVLPISQSALDVHAMTRLPNCNSQKLAAAIQRDPTLAIEVLRLANSSFYKRRGGRITVLEEAVTRIGQRYVGELSLACGLVASMTAVKLSWMDVQLTWHRSVAAGVAAELLLEATRQVAGDDGVQFGALIHGLGRVVLGTLYPAHYERMTDMCRAKNGILTQMEKRTFPDSHVRIMVRLLDGWNIPAELCDPLQYSLEDYPSVARLPDPLRGRVELIKLSILIGHIAVRKWEPWDEIEFPPAALLRRWGIESPEAIIEQTRAEAAALIRFRAARSKAPVPHLPDYVAPRRRLAYCNLSDDVFDFFPAVAASMDMKLEDGGTEILAGGKPVLLNCLGVPPQRLAALATARRDSSAAAILTDPTQEEFASRFGRTLALPVSYEALRRACQTLTGLVPIPSNSH